MKHSHASHAGWRRIWIAVFVASFVGLTAFHSNSIWAEPAENQPAPRSIPATQPDPDTTFTPQPILPNVWQERSSIVYELKDGAVWSSLGHSSVVLVIHPIGADGKLNAVRPVAVIFAIHQLRNFDEKARIPRESVVLLERRFTIEEIGREKTGSLRLRMYFPAYPPSSRIAGSEFRYCLMTSLRFSQDSGTFTKFEAAVSPIEFLRDDSVLKTSKWIEPTNGPDVSWYAREKYKAPWADGTPKSGTIDIDPTGGLKFSAGGNRPLRVLKIAPGPSLEIKQPGSDIELEPTEEKEK